MESDLTQVVVILICLSLSFLFSGMEAGVLALNRLRIRQRLRAGDRRAGLLLGFLEDRESFLWTIFIGNSLTNFLAVGLVAMSLDEWVGGNAMVFWLVFVGFILVLYALGDLLPKMLFQALPNRLCLALARPYRFVHSALSPVVSFLNWLTRGLLRWTGNQQYVDRLFATREELRLVMQETAQGLSTEERSMINRVLDFQNLVVRHVTIPLDKVVRVDAGVPMAEVLRLCRKHGFTRVPVQQMDRGRQRILGVVSLKTALYQQGLDSDKKAADYVKPALFVPENLRLEDALRRMQRGGQRLAIVLGRDQREVGIVSLQDILKALFGEVSL
ncbi:MAG TPA: hemolysin family protein [Candidatus Paceibacterota bacterium]|nr:hemolysin family protein [Verrucomicrobiota bacterium]HRY49937.1 hemolysin family protein [Candidatus Paceibacterota bacterium]